jgi:Fic family protein
MYPINNQPELPWNDLPDLPIDESLYKTVDILEQLGKAKAEIGKLQGRSVVLKNQPELLKAISLQECRASAAIDGIEIMDGALFKQASKGLGLAKGPSVAILQTQNALWWAHQQLAEGKPITMSFFIAVFRKVRNSEESIRLEMINKSIQNEGAGALANETVYTPPTGRMVIMKKLENLAYFINHSEIDPLIKMAIAHYQFEAIHPFESGNGIVGRLINILVLQREKQIDLPILYLSQFISKHRKQYTAALAGVSSRGDWTTWLLFMLKALEETAKLTFEKINQIAELKQIQINQVERKAKTIRRPDELIHALFEQPYTKVKHLTDQGVYAENTARLYLNELSKIGILEKKQLEGHHFYVNKALKKVLD